MCIPCWAGCYEAPNWTGEAVTALAYSPDGSLLAAGGAGGTVKVWQSGEAQPAGKGPAPMEVEAVLAGGGGGGGAVGTLQWLPCEAGGWLLVVGSADNTVLELWHSGAEGALAFTRLQRVTFVSSTGQVGRPAVEGSPAGPARRAGRFALQPGPAKPALLPRQHSPRSTPQCPGSAACCGCCGMNANGLLSAARPPHPYLPCLSPPRRPTPQEFFNHVEAVPQAQLLVVANTPKNVLYTLHYSGTGRERLLGGGREGRWRPCVHEERLDGVSLLGCGGGREWPAGGCRSCCKCMCPRSTA